MQPAIPSEILDLIHHLVRRLLLSCLTVRFFTSRFQSLRSKLSQLNAFLSEISDSPHWASNPILQEFLPNLLSTLQSIQVLSSDCQNPSFNGGKLLMQSDLDIASSSLSLHLHDLDLLLKSGVLRQSNAIVLSQPGPTSSTDDLAFFIRDLFTRLQIGGIEFKKKSLDSLIALLREDDKNSVWISTEGDIGYLIHLLDANNHSAIREQAGIAISILATSSESSRKIVFEEGGLGPLLRLLDSASSAIKDRSAAAIEAITADSDNAWAVSAYGGVPVLIEACKNGSPRMRNHASGALRNVSGLEEIRRTMADEGAVPVLVELLSFAGPAQGNAAHCLWILASSCEDYRTWIVDEGGLQKLLHLLQKPPSPETLEPVLRAIYALSASAITSRVLSSSFAFLLQLAELIKHGNLTLQQISVALVCNLSLCDTAKRGISSSMGALVKMIDSSKPVGLQDIATRALVSLLMVRANRRNFVRDEKSISRIVQMLDPKNEAVSKKFPILVVLALASGTGPGYRKRLAAAGASQHLQMLAEMDVAGAKKALQKLKGNCFKNIFSRT